ncbi:bromodomain adjacent to zinc finger domain protein 1A-like isoform X2 [Diadema setosum]|uniref:bromodomain adjacent to zinc finger domain protein 1A-like isoform X2 n=1 Tax=Diadema setosum TaxID=31175 RepID=UPI003B3AA485
MPLLRRREFRPAKPPKDLQPDEEVFLCRLTNEIFRDYDDFFKRTILCNSLVWSCSLTGRPGLTYQEAMESEERALKYLASFPVYLEPPVLYLAQMTKRGRLSDMCDDIFLFVKDRFFVGEIVDVVHLDTRETCRVNRVIVPPQYSADVSASESSDDEIIFVMDNGKEEKMKSVHAEHKTPKRSLPAQMLKPSMYKYEVTSLQGSGTYIAPHSNVSRKRGLYTRDKNKLYLKHHCHVVDYIWTVKSQYVQKFRLNERRFEEFFAGPPPNFSSTPAKRNTHKVMQHSEQESSADDDDDANDSEDSDEDDDDIPLMEVKKKAAAKGGEKKKRKYKTSNKENREAKVKKPRLTPEEKAALKAKLKQERLAEKMLRKQKMAEEKAKAKAQLREEQARAKEEQRVQREQEKAARREQIRKDIEESKERRRKEKEEERERQRIRFEYMKEYMRPRDDLECDDHKELPKALPVTGLIPQELFGDCVLLLEFLHAFGDQLAVSEDFPDGVSLEMLEEALTSNKVDGSLYDIMRFLLKSLFRVQEEDEVEWKSELEEQGVQVPKVNIAEARLEEDPDPTYAAMTRAATAALAWPVVHQGMELRNLPIEPTTVTEIIRLHFLSSGAQTGSEDSKWRYQQRGGYTCHDDPGLEFRMHDSWILKTLTKGNLFDLSPEGKMKILKTLTNQLLTYVTMRDVIEGSFDNWMTSRRELKELQRQEQRREKEEVTARWRLRMEERAHEKLQREQTEKERLEKLAQEGFQGVVNGASPVSSGTLGGTPESTNRTQSRNKGDSPSDSMDTEGTTPGMTPAEIEGKRKEIEAESCAKKAEFLKEEERLSKEIAEAIMMYSVTPLGEDRYFRRYWKFNSLPGLYVECNRNVDMDVLKEMVHEMNVCQRTSFEVNGKERDVQVLCDHHNTSNNSNKENEDTNIITNGQMETDDHAVPSEIPKQQTDSGKEIAMEVDREMPQLTPQTSTAEESAPECQWAFYNDPSDVDKLVESLNVRGFREAALRDALQQEKAKLVSVMKNVPTEFLTKSKEEQSVTETGPAVRKQVEVKMNSGKKGLLSNTANGEEKLELMLREQILDIEDRMWQGALGFVKVPDRAGWVEAIEQGSYDRQTKEISWGPVWARSILNDGDFLNMSMSDLPLPDDRPKSKDRLSSLKKAENTPTGSPVSTRCNTPDATDNVVRDLACALLQVSQGADDKYLKAPLGKQEDVKPMTRNRKKQEEEKAEEEEDTEEEKKPQKTCRECWEESLMACTSLSQIFLHLATLERSVTWNKSILKARCRMCRRGGNPEQMLLCDGCNRGHHMFCLKPPLKKVPQGDWFCKDCTPKEIKRSPHKQRVMKKKPIVEESDEEEEEEEEDDDSEEDSEEESEEESVDEESEDEEAEDDESEEEDEMEVDVSDDEEEDEDDDDDEEDSENDVSEEEEEDSDEEGNEHDNVCTRCRHGGQLVCCDTCPKAFHMECCKPVLRKVPRGQWECEDCKKQAKSSAIKVPTGKKGEVKKFASKPKRESPKPQPKVQEKSGAKGRSQSKTRSSRQNTPEPTPTPPSRNSKNTKKEEPQPASGGRDKRGKAGVQEKPKGGRQASVERRGQKRGLVERSESTDSESSQEEAVKRSVGKGSYRVVLNGSLNIDDSASDSSGPSFKNRRSSSGRGNNSLAQLTKCENLLKELIKHRDAGPFLNAVSKRSAPDYYRIIKRPMDFAAMQTKVNDFQYSTPAEFISDARLIFTNCQQYNRCTSMEYKAGLKMSAFLEKRLKELDIEPVSSPPAGHKDQNTPTSRKRSRQR